MHEHCPVCSLKFEREQGYFVGAMYIAYMMAAAILLAASFLLWLMTRWAARIVVVTGAVFVPLTPVVFRYSRVIWLHMDYAIEPW